MIDGFHASNDLHHLGIMPMNVLDQFGLCICGAGDQNRTGVRDGLDDGMKIIMVRRSMTAADAARSEKGPQLSAYICLFVGAGI